MATPKACRRTRLRPLAMSSAMADKARTIGRVLKPSNVFTPVAVEVQRVGCEAGEVSKYSAPFARKTQWFDAEAEQPCRVTEAEVADITCAGMNDQRTRELG